MLSNLVLFVVGVLVGAIGTVLVIRNNRAKANAVIAKIPTKL